MYSQIHFYTMFESKMVPIRSALWNSLFHIRQCTGSIFPRQNGTSKKQLDGKRMSYGMTLGCGVGGEVSVGM